jgi:hypothetical protein
VIKAIEVCFPTSVRIRCWFHRLANIRGKLPDEAASEVLAHVYAVAGSAHRGRRGPVLQHLRAGLPGRGACFTDDLEAMLAIHRVPSGTGSGSGPRTCANARSSRNAAGPKSSRVSPMRRPRQARVRDPRGRNRSLVPSQRQRPRATSAHAAPCRPRTRLPDDQRPAHHPPSQDRSSVNSRLPIYRTLRT